MHSDLTHLEPKKKKQADTLRQWKFLRRSAERPRLSYAPNEPLSIDSVRSVHTEGVKEVKEPVVDEELFKQMRVPGMGREAGSTLALNSDALLKTAASKSKLVLHTGVVANTEKF